MASQPQIPEGQSRYLRETGKNARMQRQYFNRAGEPMYSSLLMALMDRAGLNPMSLLHPQRNQQPQTSPTQQPQMGAQGAPAGGHGLPAPMPAPSPGPQMAGERSQSPAPGLGMGQPGVMTGAANPTGGSMELQQPPDVMGRLAGVMGGAPQGAGGGMQNGGGIPNLGGGMGGGMGGMAMGQKDSPFGLRGMGGGGGGGGNRGGGGRGGMERLNGGGNRGGGGGQVTDHSQIYQDQGSGLSDPNNIGGSQGWTDTDRMAWQSGVSNINNQFGNLANRAQFQSGQNLGAGQNSIGAGLQAQLARQQGDAMTNLGQQVTMGGIQQQDQRMQMLMQALQPLMGFPAQAAQGASAAAQGWGQTAQQGQGGLGGLGALAYLFS